MNPAEFMDLLGLSTGEVERMALIISRLTGLFLSAPFFSRAVGPARIRVTLILVLTVVLYPVVPHWSGEGRGQSAEMFLATVREFTVGATTGLIVHWLLVAAQAAGNIMGVQVGLSMAQVMDPTSGMQEGVISNILYLAGLMVFLTMDGHLMLIQGLANSFRHLPPGGELPPSDYLLRGVIAGLTRMFELAMLMASPIIALSVLVYLGLGLINRAAPQIQVFFVATPLTLVLGILVVGWSLSYFSQVLVTEMDHFMANGFRLFAKK